MLNVGSITAKPFCAKPFSIIRITSAPENEGEFTQHTNVTLNRTGSIQPASQNDIATWAPEGDRSAEYIKVYCNQSLRMGDGSTNHSDIILHNSKKFRIIAMKHYEDYGYWFAVAERISDSRVL